MILDAAASAGNSTIDLFGTTVPDGASIGTGTATPPPFVFAFPTQAAPPPPDNTGAPTEPAADSLPFSALFEDATAGLGADTEETAASEPGDEEPGNEGPAPIQNAATETVAPETLRLIFPAHYFYTDTQVREAATASDTPEPAPESSHPATRTSALTATPANPRPAIAISPAPQLVPVPNLATAPSDSPESAFALGEAFEAIPEAPTTLPIEVLPTPFAATPAPIEPAIQHAIAQSAPKLPSVAVLPANHNAQLTAIHTPDTPVQRIEAHTTTTAPATTPNAPTNPTFSPAPTPTPPHAAIEPEPPPPTPRPAAEAPPLAASLQSQSPGSEGNQDDHARDGGANHREPAPTAAPAKPTHADAPRKEERTELTATAPHLEPRPPVAESYELATRPIAVPTRDAAEPAAPNSETPAPVQASAKAAVEPLTPASPSRSVSLSIAGPQGEDVRAVVQASGEGVQVRLQAGDERTQQALQQGAPELRLRLEEVQRVPSGDMWEGMKHTTETIADVQAPDARFGSQHDSNHRDSPPSREDNGGQRQGQRGFGRGEREPDPEAAGEEFAAHFQPSQFQQGGRS